MNDCTTTKGYIKNLWLRGNLKQLTANDILSFAKSQGYTFSRNAIQMVLLRSDFIAKPEKINGVMTYSQKYPPDQNSTIEESYVTIFKELKLHEDIRKVSSKLFLDSHYDQAIFAAFKKVNNLIKEKSNQHSKDGKDLMLSTFTSKQPILKINNFVTESEINEQEGFMHIFAGAMQGIRNPQGHDDEIGENPWNTIELLCLASLLAKKIEKSKLNKTNKKLGDKKLTK